MEALLCRNLGDPTVRPDGAENSALTVSTTYPIPQLNSPTAVRVRVKATSLNFANYLQILGKYQEKLPFAFCSGLRLLGHRRGCGTRSHQVQNRGSGVARNVGNKLLQNKSLRRVRKFLVPEGCDLVAAGALPVAYGTSHVALVHRAHLCAGQVLLVLGAAGGVGVSAIQIGKVCGAIVIAVARGDEKAQFLKSLGVDFVVDVSKENVIESVKGFLKTKRLKGVDVLYDPVGGKLTKETLKLLNWGAQILVIGFASGEVPVIPANIALVKNWTVHGLYWGSYNIYRPHVLQDSLKELLSWLARGLITIKISHTFSLSEANLAFAALKDRKAIGKVLIAFNDQKTTRSKL
ncbi:UNVERIFIED_CONTAM: Quinone oxidoreductase-like protein 2 [Sesamum radiatum]|uniref:Quinone oxidoreductase-like protein 2 n=1 Tax=Sesamum radiatum TaxID=300843 RepID=A0AAW2NBR6_SESRA